LEELMNGLTRAAGAVLLSASSAFPAFAGNSYSGVSGLSFTAIDMNPGDGIDAAYTILGGTLTAQVGTGAGGSGPLNTSTTSFSFDSWPTGTQFGGTLGNGAQASYYVGPDSVAVWGTSGSTGSFIAGLTLSLNIEVTPYTQLIVSGNIVQGMTGTRIAEEQDHTQAATDLALNLGGGFPYFGDGGPYKNYVTGNYANVPGSWMDASTADTWLVSQSRSFSIPHDGGISAFERVRLVGLTVGALGNAAPVTAVPEPSTYALMLAGLAVVGMAARRRTLTLRRS
jgi:hypothetical protein